MFDIKKLIALVCVTFIATQIKAGNVQESSETKKLDVYNFHKLHEFVIEVWEDHIWWTREVIGDTIINSKCPNNSCLSTRINFDLPRLLRNARDLGNLFVPCWGAAVGNQVEILFRAHLTLGKKVVDAFVAANGNTSNPLYIQAQNEWHQNAIDIANYLHSLNPEYEPWSFDNWKDMLFEHLEYTTNEAALEFACDWPADIQNFDDEVLPGGLEMADLMARGIYNFCTCQ